MQNEDAKRQKQNKSKEKENENQNETKKIPIKKKIETVFYVCTQIAPSVSSEPPKTFSL